MKFQVSALLTLAIGSSTAALANPCDPADLDKIRQAILPRITLGAGFVSGLIDQVVAGNLDCELNETAYSESGMTLAVCGATKPDRLQELTIKGRTHSWKFTVYTEKVSCYAPQSSLLAVSAARGNLIRYIVEDGKITAQVRGNGCESAYDYIALKFSYTAPDESGRLAVRKVTKLLNTSDEASGSCTRPLSRNGVKLELSRDKLGLTDDDIEDLK